MKIFKYLIGIYQIRNTITGDCYIGQSTNLVARRYNHFRLLNLNKSHSIILQNAYNKYGKDAFVFEVILYCESSMLDQYEQNLTEFIHPKYNVRKDVISNRGHVVSEETKQKISTSQRGKIISEEQKKIIGDAHRGKCFLSNEQRQEYSNRMLGGNGFHPTSKFTVDDILNIRKMRKESKMSFGKIANLFGVDRQTIYSICIRKTWKHVT